MQVYIIVLTPYKLRDDAIVGNSMPQPLLQSLPPTECWEEVMMMGIRCVKFIHEFGRLLKQNCRKKEN